MIRRVDLRGKRLSKSEINKAIPRAKLDVMAAMQIVTPILEQVRVGAESDLIKLAEKFDGVAPTKIRVPKAELDTALLELDPKVRTALEIAAERIRKVHRDQIRSEKVTEVVSGATVTEKWVPVDRVGLYVPGGRAVYPSSVLMNVIPAQIAKVPSIAVASPPQIDNNGWPNKTILATCALLGIEEVYAIGGAQAIALFAYGMAGVCEKADLVTGPGNIYVAAAKRALRGEIGIDSEAGPTEIAILADESAIADIRPVVHAAIDAIESDHPPLRYPVASRLQLALEEAFLFQCEGHGDAEDYQTRILLRGNAERVEHADPVMRHVGEGVGHLGRKADLLAQDLDRQAGRAGAFHLLAEADVAVVVADHAEALAHQRLDQLVRPQRHLRAEAHHQQDHVMRRVAVILVEDFDAGGGRGDGGHGRADPLRPAPVTSTRVRRYRSRVRPIGQAPRRVPPTP